MICSNCGNQIPDGTQFCTYCGASQANNIPVEQPMGVQDVPQNAYNTVPVTPYQNQSPDMNGYASQPVDINAYGAQQPVDMNAYGVQQPVDMNAYGAQQPVDMNAYGVQQPVDMNAYGAQQPVDMNAYGVQQPMDMNAYQNQPIFESTQGQSGVNQFQAPPQTPQAPKKKSNVGVIIGIAVAAVVVIGGGLFYYVNNRPIAKVRTAIESDDIYTVADQYGKLNDADKANTQTAMIDYCTRAYNDYYDEWLTYDQVRADYDILGAEVLYGNSDYDFLSAELDDLKASRDAYAKGNDAFNAGDYETAVVYYLQVSAIDSYYDSAVDKMIEAESLMIPDVVGNWRAQVDIGYAITKSFGYTSTDLLSFPMDFVLDLDENGNFMLALEYVSDYTPIDDFIFFLIADEMVNDSIELGISTDELDELMYEIYGMSYFDYMYENEYYNPDYDGIIATLESYAYGTYIVEDDFIYIYADNGTVDTLQIMDDAIVLNEYSESMGDLVESGITFPLYLYKY